MLKWDLYPCRYFVIHKLPGLTFLDSRAVSGGERKEAKRVGAFMRVVRPPDETVSSVQLYTSMCHVQSNTPHFYVTTGVLPFEACRGVMYNRVGKFWDTCP